MKSVSAQPIASRPSARRLRAIRGLAIAFGLFAGSTQAQWIVHDPGAVIANHADSALEYAKQGLQFAKQLEQYATQLEQYRQLLSTIQGFASGMSLIPNTLEHVTNTDAIVQGKCAGVSGVNGLISTVMNSMGSLMGQSITQTQQMLCKQIVLKQIDKYNETVDMLNKLNTYSGQFQQVEQIAGAISTLADTGRASTQVEKYSSAVQTEMSDWQAKMTVDDSIIKTLQDQQSILGHIALRGSNTVLGNVVDATTFAAAFH